MRKVQVNFIAAHWLTAFSPHRRFRHGVFATYYGRRFRHTTIFPAIPVSGFTTARRTGINGIRTLTLLIRYGNKVHVTYRYITGK